MLRAKLHSMKLFQSFTFLTKNFGYFGRLSRNSSNTSLTKKRQKERLLLAKLHSMTDPPVVKVFLHCLKHSLVYKFYIKSSNTSSQKRDKRKKIYSAWRTPLLSEVFPHWPNLMGQIREQTFATLYATPPLPYCYVLAAVTEALESISFFVMCEGWLMSQGESLSKIRKYYNTFLYFRAYAFMELRLIDFETWKFNEIFVKWFDITKN